MNAEVLLNWKIRVDVHDFVTQRTRIYFFILFGILFTVMRLNRAMISTKDLRAILALDW